MKGPARRRGPGARLSGRRLAGRLFLAAREAAASLLKKARYPDALPGIPLLLPLGRRPAQARVKSSTLRAEVNAFNRCGLRYESGGRTSRGWATALTALGLPRNELI